jgi:hypothetical protein
MVAADDAAVDARRQILLMLHEEVNVVLQQAGWVRSLHLAQLDLDFGVPRADAAHPRRDHLLHFERSGLDTESTATDASPHVFDHDRQALEERRAERQQLLTGTRGDHVILSDLLEQLQAELSLELTHLGVNTRLGDGVGKGARGARVVAGLRHAEEALELVELNHSLRIIDLIKKDNWL